MEYVSDICDIPAYAGVAEFSQLEITKCLGIENLRHLWLQFKLKDTLHGGKKRKCNPQGGREEFKRQKMQTDNEDEASISTLMKVKEKEDVPADAVKKIKNITHLKQKIRQLVGRKNEEESSRSKQCKNQNSVEVLRRTSFNPRARTPKSKSAFPFESTTNTKPGKVPSISPEDSITTRNTLPSHSQPPTLLKTGERTSISPVQYPKPPNPLTTTSSTINQAGKFPTISTAKQQYLKKPAPGIVPPPIRLPSEGALTSLPRTPARQKERKERETSPRSVPLPLTPCDNKIPSPWSPKPHQIPLPTTPNPRRKKKLGKVTPISPRIALTTIDPYLIPLPPTPKVGNLTSISPTLVSGVNIASTPMSKGRKIKKAEGLDAKASTLSEGLGSHQKPNVVQRLQNSNAIFDFIYV